MDAAIIVALIALAGSIFAAPISSYFSKKREIEVEWQRKKISYYEALLTAMSDLALDIKNDDAQERFSKAINIIVLIADGQVVHALMDFHDEIKISNPNRTLEKHNELLNRLIVAIRKDVGLTKDEESSLNFHLVGSGPSHKP